MQCLNPDCEVGWSLEPGESEQTSRCWNCGGPGEAGYIGALVFARAEIRNPTRIATDGDEMVPVVGPTSHAHLAPDGTAPAN